MSAVVVGGAIQVNLVIMTVVAAVAGVAATAKKYVETLFVLVKSHPKGLAFGIMAAAWYFCYNLFTIAVSDTEPLLVYMRPALAFGFITLIYGPFLILTPTRPIVIAKKSLAKMMMVPKKKHTPWARIIVFVILCLMQLYVIFCIVWFFPLVLTKANPSLQNGSFEMIQLLIGITVGYFLLSAFYLVAFYAVILGHELTVKNINLLDVIRKSIKIKRGPEKPPLDILCHKHYPKVYLLLFLGATAGIFALVIQLLIIETSATMWVAIGALGQAVAIIAFIINIVTAGGLAAFIFGKVVHPVDSVTEIKLDDGTTLAVDRIKHLSIARSADRLRLLDYAKPMDPHTKQIQETITGLTKSSCNDPGYHRTTLHEHWSGVVHQSNDTLCMFFVATGASYVQDVAFMFLHEIQERIADTYYDLNGFDMYAPNEWSQPMHSVVDELAEKYSDNKELKKIKPAADDWAKVYHAARAEDDKVLEQMKENAKLAVEQLDSGLKKLNEITTAATVTTTTTDKGKQPVPDQTIVPSIAPISIQPLSKTDREAVPMMDDLDALEIPEPEPLIEPVESDADPEAKDVDLELAPMKGKGDVEDGFGDSDSDSDDEDEDKVDNEKGVWQPKMPKNLLEGPIPHAGITDTDGTDAHATLKKQMTEAVGDALEALRLRVERLESAGQGWRYPTKLCIEGEAGDLVLSEDGLTITSKNVEEDADDDEEVISISTEVTYELDSESTPDTLAVVSDEGKMIEYIGAGETNEDAIMVLTKKPIAAAAPAFYMEIRIDSVGKDGSIGLGLAPVGQPRLGMPGWYNKSYGYHGDDGATFHHKDQGRGNAYGPTWSVGDHVGMGWDPSTGDVRYTLNGKDLGVAFTDVKGSFYPTVGFHSTGARVRVSFDSFKYPPVPPVKPVKPVTAVSNTAIAHGVFVFETSLKKVNKHNVKIGVTSSPSSASVSELDIAYDGATGDVSVGSNSSNNNNNKSAFGPKLKSGDVIACQLDFKLNKVVFAVNGVYLGSVPSSLGVKLMGKQLFPAISISNVAGSDLKVHFSDQAARFPEAFGVQRYTPFIGPSTRNPDTSHYHEAYVECERTLRGALTSIHNSSRTDSPLQIPITTVIQDTLDRVSPFISHALNPASPLAVWQQVSIDIVVRAGLVEARNVLIKGGLAASHGLGLELDLRELGDEMKKEVLPYVLTVQVLRMMRWAKMESIGDAVRYIKRCQRALKKIEEAFNGDAMLRAIQTYVKGVLEMLEGDVGDKKKKKEGKKEK